MEPVSAASPGPETPLPIKPNLKLASLQGVQSPAGSKRFPDLMGADITEEEAAREKVVAHPPRTLEHPFVAETPPRAVVLSFAEAQVSCVTESKLFRLETPDTPLDDYVLPLDDTIDANSKQ